MTVRRYLDILEGTFMVRLLQPWHTNIGKRLVKRPKRYIRDSGILHVLLAIRSPRDLATHNKLGASWEGFALEVAARAIGKRHEALAFWATHTGAGVDLFWQERGRNWSVAFKYADAPRLSRSVIWYDAAPHSHVSAIRQHTDLLAVHAPAMISLPSPN